MREVVKRLFVSLSIHARGCDVIVLKPGQIVPASSFSLRARNRLTNETYDISGKDGWVYGGVSKTTGRPFFIAPTDATTTRCAGSVKDSAKLFWQEAQDLAGEAQARLPSIVELGQIRNLRHAHGLRGTFFASARSGVDDYWSADFPPENPGTAWVQSLADATGLRTTHAKTTVARVRLVSD